MAESCENNHGTSKASSPNMKPLEQQTPKTSNPKTIKTNTFTFEVKPARKLKHAIRALSDAVFNKRETAMIEVDRRGVSITVHSAEHDVSGFLLLKTAGLENFDVVKPLKRKKVNLRKVSRYLDLVGEDLAINFYHVDGSDELTFKTKERSHVIEFGVELNEIEPQFEEFPIIHFACSCVVPNEFLSVFLARVGATTNKLVSVDISDSRALFFVGGQTLISEYDPNKGVCRGLEKGQSHLICFTLPHYNALKKAMPLAVGALLCLTSDSKKSIVFRYYLGDLGDLLFVKEATTLSAIKAVIPTDQTQAGKEDIG